MIPQRRDERVDHIKAWRGYGWQSDAGYEALRQMMASLSLLVQAYAEEVLVPYLERL